MNVRVYISIDFSYSISLAQRQLSTMNSSFYNSTSPFYQQQQQHQQYQQQEPIVYTTDVTPHPIQPTVLAMCQAIVPSGPISTSSSLPNDYNDWFNKLLSEPQSVILTPPSRVQTSPTASRRAVRIQIINKHDDIALSAPPLLPMTPSPLSTSSIVFDETTPTLADYLCQGGSTFNIPSNQNELAPVIDDTMGI